ADLAAEHRLVERDWQLEPQVGAHALEQRMRRDRHRDQHVTGAAARTGEPLALEPDLLALGKPGRDPHLDLLAARQLHTAPGALGGLRQGDRDRGGDVAAMRLSLLLLEGGTAGPRASCRACEHVLEEILEAAEPGPGAVGTAAAALEAAGSEGERFEHALAVEATARSGAEAFEAVEARLALGIDLAAVEGLALLGLADDLVGGVDLGEAGRRLGIVLVGVRMVLLGELTERALDVRRARALGHAQDLIGVAHPQSLRQSSSRPSGTLP